jgi:hypothetical protein
MLGGCVGSFGKMQVWILVNDIDAIVNYGPPSHWKGFCDGKFQQHNKVLGAAVASRDVTGIDDYLSELKDPLTPRLIIYFLQK